MNKDYTAVSAQTGGLVVNYLPTSNSVTTAGAGVITVPGDIEITLSSQTADTLTAGMFVQAHGATLTENNGIFKVVSNNTASLLVLETTLAANEDFLQNIMTATTDTGITFTQINLSVLRAGTDGTWEVGVGGDTSSMTFSNLITGSSGVEISSTSNTEHSIVRMDTATSDKTVQDSGITIDDSDNISMPSTAGNITMPTSATGNAHIYSSAQQVDASAGNASPDGFNDVYFVTVAGANRTGTLADGSVDGQRASVHLSSQSGGFTYTLTITNALYPGAAAGSRTATFNTAGQSIHLEWDATGGNWMPVNAGATIA